MSDAHSMEKKTLGWECPNCHKVYSPDVKTCNCSKTEVRDENSLVDINENQV